MSLVEWTEPAKCDSVASVLVGSFQWHLWTFGRPCWGVNFACLVCFTKYRICRRKCSNCIKGKECPFTSWPAVSPMLGTICHIPCPGDNFCVLPSFFVPVWREVWGLRKIDKRQLIELGGHLVNNEFRLIFFFSSALYTPIQRGRGRQETSLPWYKELTK